MSIDDANNKMLLRRNLFKLIGLQKLLKVEEFLALPLLQWLGMVKVKLALEGERLKKYQLQFKRLWKTLEEA